MHVRGDAIVAEYQAGGATLNQLARKHHVSNRRIRALVSQAGLLRPHGTGNAYQLTEKTSRAIAEDYAAGVGIVALKRKYHVGDHKVYEALDEHGIAPRPALPRCPHCGGRLDAPLGLTPRQQELLDFIRAEIHDRGSAPSYDEMCLGIGARSKSQIFRLLEHLQRRGHIVRMPGSARSIAVVTP